MTPEQAISQLDRQLAQHGRLLTLRRRTGTGTALIQHDAQVRGVISGATPDTLQSAIDQTTRKVILSPTEMTRRKWPGPVGDQRIRTGDFVVDGAKESAVVAVDPKYIRDELVRIDLVIKG